MSWVVQLSLPQNPLPTVVPFYVSSFTLNLFFLLISLNPCPHSCHSCWCVCLFLNVIMYVCMCVPWCRCGGRKITLKSQFFPTTLWDPRIKFRPWGLYASSSLSAEPPLAPHTVTDIIVNTYTSLGRCMSLCLTCSSSSHCLYSNKISIMPPLWLPSLKERKTRQIQTNMFKV